MFCPRCGTDNDDHDARCSSCGAPLDAAAASAPSIAPVPSHLLKAALVTLLCFLPTGIVAVVYASRVGALTLQGDLDGARRASRLADLWANLSLGAGVVSVVLWVAFVLLVGGASAAGCHAPSRESLRASVSARGPAGHGAAGRGAAGRGPGAWPPEAPRSPQPACGRARD